MDPSGPSTGSIASVPVPTCTEAIEPVEGPDGSTTVRVRLSDGQVIDAGLVDLLGHQPRHHLDHMGR
ncbi:hypothetical protein JHV675_52490 [Mycobacterium avium subsp. hominissuis]